MGGALRSGAPCTPPAATYCEASASAADGARAGETPLDRPVLSGVISVCAGSMHANRAGLIRDGRVGVGECGARPSARGRAYTHTHTAASRVMHGDQTPPRVKKKRTKKTQRQTRKTQMQPGLVEISARAPSAPPRVLHGDQTLVQYQHELLVRHRKCRKEKEKRAIAGTLRPAPAQCAHGNAAGSHAKKKKRARRRERSAGMADTQTRRAPTLREHAHTHKCGSRTRRAGIRPRRPRHARERRRRARASSDPIELRPPPTRAGPEIGGARQWGCGPGALMVTTAAPRA